MEAALATSVGLKAFGALEEGAGKSAGYRYQEDRAERLALDARTAADQTDSQLRDQLQTTLGNVAAIRAAAGGSASPTEDAIISRDRDISKRQREIQVGNLKSQASQYDRDASYFGYASQNALDLGFVNAFSKGLGGLAG